MKKNRGSLGGPRKGRFGEGERRGSTRRCCGAPALCASLLSSLLLAARQDVLLALALLDAGRAAACGACPSCLCSRPPRHPPSSPAIQPQAWATHCTPFSTSSPAASPLSPGWPTPCPPAPSSRCSAAAACAGGGLGSAALAAHCGILHAFVMPPLPCLQLAAAADSSAHAAPLIVCRRRRPAAGCERSAPSSCSWRVQPPTPLRLAPGPPALVERAPAAQPQSTQAPSSP